MRIEEGAVRLATSSPSTTHMFRGGHKSKGPAHSDGLGTEVSQNRVCAAVIVNTASALPNICNQPLCISPLDFLAGDPPKSIESRHLSPTTISHAPVEHTDLSDRRI